jgi:HopJ type III effector protein
MTLNLFIEKLKLHPELVTFAETISIIDTYYSFTPTGFQNGTQYNAGGENSGSCKIFFFAHLQNLTPIETLTCFGDYYFIEVLQNSEGTNHQNIRNFIKTGWEGIHFEGIALVAHL